MATDSDLKLPADLPEWGPKMRALPNDRQRAFVLALFAEDCPEKHDGQNLFAAHKAGYGNADGSTSDKALSVIAARLRNDTRIQAAIGEVFRGVVHSMAPDAARELRFKLGDRKGRDQIRAIAAVADRLAPIETTATLKIEDSRPPSPEAIERVLARIEELARRAGLKLPAPQTIDGEFSVVGDAA